MVNSQMEFVELVQAAKRTSEKADAATRHYLDCVMNGKTDPEFRIETFLYEIMITLYLEKNLIERIEKGIEAVQKAAGSGQQSVEEDVSPDEDRA